MTFVKGTGLDHLQVHVLAVASMAPDLFASSQPHSMRLFTATHWLPTLPLKLCLVVALGLSGCAGDEAWPPDGIQWDPESPEARAILAAPVPDSPINPQMAEVGERFYRNRGCLGCHSLGRGDVVGPDLEQVVSRRNYAWFRGMVMNPDSMNRVDPDARGLAARFLNPMPNQGVPEVQVRAIWEFLRQVDREVAEQ